MTSKIIIYSHGFGVRKDDRGLFTDIAVSLPDFDHIMFDYNTVNEQQNTLTVTSLTEQASMLEETINKAKSSNPDAQIDLVCHSQGCVVAAMLSPEGIHKTIFTTPPSSLGIKRMLKFFGEREGAVVDVNGLTTFPRRDGSTTNVPSDYWTSLEGVSPIDLYNKLSKQTKLSIISANQDEVLGETDFSGLDPAITMTNIDANHDFTGESRSMLIQKIKSELN